MRRGVLLAESAAEELIKRSGSSIPFETGGILLGMLGDGEPWIVRAIEIPSATPAPRAYKLPAGVTKAAVGEARKKDPRLGYLGDWHSHPADAAASGIDIRTYLRSLWFAFRQTEQLPLLVIVRLTSSGWVLDAVAAQRWPPLLRRMGLILTGPPPPVDERSRSEQYQAE